MDILERINLLDDLCEYIHNINRDRSNFFFIYLFGSILRIDAKPKDIDILVIYTHYDRNEIIRWKNLLNDYSSLVGIPIDCTIMSKAENMETKFIDRINAFRII